MHSAKMYIAANLILNGSHSPISSYMPRIASRTQMDIYRAYGIIIGHEDRGLYVEWATRYPSR